MSKTNVYRFSEYRLDTKKNNKKVGNTEGRKIMNIIIDYVHGHSELASVMTSVLYKLRYTDYPMENEEIIAVSNAAVTATQEGNEQAAIILENFVSRGCKMFCVNSRYPEREFTLGGCYLWNWSPENRFANISKTAT